MKIIYADVDIDIGCTFSAPKNAVDLGNFVSRIGFGTNLGVLTALRGLASASTTLARANERLASGQRINRAADDAAGLAISQSLSTSSRIYGQGIRNFNDGISLLNIADGSLDSLQGILTRQQELAEQAASGTLSTNQRTSLNREFTGLRNEYNRIIEGTKFNGLRLLDGSTRSVRFQGGSSVSESINITLLNQQASTLHIGGTGNYSQGANINEACDAFAAADLNGDGFADYVTAYVDTQIGQSDLHIVTHLGDGHGNFSSTDTRIFAVSDPLANITNVTLAINDSDGDQIQDLNVTFDWEDGSSQHLGETGYMKNDGNGNLDSFSSAFSSGDFQTGMNQNHYIDIDGDGVEDYFQVTNRVDYIYIQKTGLIGSAGSSESLAQNSYDITTVAGARTAMDAIESLRTQISGKRGEIGATMSRLTTGISNLRSLKEGYDTAKARITDVDVAETVALQTRALIQQQLATQVLGQASHLPQLLLDLLR